MSDEARPVRTDILRHMLGIDLPEKREPVPYRNYYCAGHGNADLQELERQGLVELYSKRDGYDWYRCTDAGQAAAIASHKAIRYSKAKRVYIRYLEVSDAFQELTFKDFLTHPHFAETRKNA